MCMSVRQELIFNHFDRIVTRRKATLAGTLGQLDTQDTIFSSQILLLYLGTLLCHIDMVIVPTHANEHTDPDSKVHGANMGPIWGGQDPGGPHVGPMNFAIWGGLDKMAEILQTKSNTFSTVKGLEILSKLHLDFYKLARSWASARLLLGTKHYMNQCQHSSLIYASQSKDELIQTKPINNCDKKTWIRSSNMRSIWYEIATLQ